MFLGEYSPNITDGSRIALPKKMRDQVGSDSVVMARGFEKCIYIYDQSDWSEQAQKQIENQKEQNTKVNDLERYIFTSAEQVTIDTQGRVVMPSSLQAYAGIKKELSVLGVGDRIEVWDRKTWKEYQAKISAKIGD